MMLAAQPRRAGRPRHTRNAGFTLLEMLVVTLISLVVFITGFVLITGTSEARAKAISRLRATENARLFFQLLERDLAGAYKGPGDVMTRGRLAAATAYPVSAPYPIVIEDKDAGGVSYDILQFYTRADTHTVTDEYVFVRYFVNRADLTLCRQVLPYDPSLSAPPENVDPRPLLVTSIEVDPSVGAYTVFDEVTRLYVVHRLWNEQTKTLEPTGVSDQKETTGLSGEPVPGACTHLLVTLIMRYSQDGGKTYTDRTFTRLLPIAAGLK